MDIWYYSDGTLQLGPISLKQLKSMFQAGKLNGNTLVFGPKLKDWTPAGQLPDLFPQGAGPPSGENKQGSVADNFHNNGLAHAKRNEYDKAILDYNKAIALNPTRGAMYKNRGSAHLVLEHFDDAIADFNKAIELNPERSEAYFQRGNAHKAMEHFDEAIADYEMVLKLKPHFEKAATNRNKALAKWKERKKGSKYSGYHSQFILRAERGNPDSLLKYQNLYSILQIFYNFVRLGGPYLLVLLILLAGVLILF